MAAFNFVTGARSPFLPHPFLSNTPLPMPMDNPQDQLPTATSTTTLPTSSAPGTFTSDSSPPAKLQVVPNPYSPDYSLLFQTPRAKSFDDIAREVATHFKIVFLKDTALINRNYEFFSQELAFPQRNPTSDFSPASPSSSPNSVTDEIDLATLKSSFRAQVVSFPNQTCSE